MLSIFSHESIKSNRHAGLSQKKLCPCCALTPKKRYNWVSLAGERTVIDVAFERTKTQH